MSDLKLALEIALRTKNLEEIDLVIKELKEAGANVDELGCVDNYRKWIIVAAK